MLVAVLSCFLVSALTTNAQTTHTITRDRMIEGHTPAIRDAFPTWDGQFIVALDYKNYSSKWGLGDGVRLRYEYLDYEDWYAGAMAKMPGRGVYMTLDTRWDDAAQKRAYGLRLWRIRDGSLVRAMPGTWGDLPLDGCVWNAADLSIDRAYTAGAGKLWPPNTAAVLVWNTSDGSVVFQNTDDAGNATCVAISPDSKYIAAGGRWEDPEPPGGYVRVWEIATGNLVRTFQHGQSVRALDFAPDSRTLVYGGKSLGDADTVKVSDVVTGDLLLALPHEDFLTTAISVTPDGQTILTGDLNSVRMWSLGDGSLLRIVRDLHAGSMQSLSTALDGQVLVTAGGDGTMKVTEIESGQILRSVGMGSLKAAVMTPDSRFVISASGDGALRQWDRFGGELVHTSVERHTAPIASINMAPMEKYLITSASGTDKTLRLWRASDLRPGPSFDHLPYGRPRDAVRKWHGGGRWSAVSGGNGGMVVIWDGPTQSVRHELEHGGDIRSVALSPDTQYVVSGAGDG